VSEWIRKRPDGRLDAIVTGGKVLTVDQVMLAIGRIPNTENMGLEGIGIEMTAAGAIKVDDYSRTNIDNIWAIGDVTNRVQLTPVAIHEAMCFVETAFRNNPTKADHRTIPTAVFSQPEIGTVGLTEDEASSRFDDIEVYRAVFRPMRNTLAGRDERMLVKLVVETATRVVVGAHILGTDAAELAQVLGIAVKAGLTKDDFDRTMALHPTAAEELVTMYHPTYRVRNNAADRQ
jgi:glutathione reductase (NADPH)